MCDPGGLLGPEGVRELDGLLRSVRAGGGELPLVPCASSRGAAGVPLEVGVAVLRGVGGPGGGLSAAGAQQAAKALHREWGVGRPDCGNGALVLLSVADRRVHVSTGDGARRLAPDWLVERAVQDMRPALRVGDYSAALAGLIGALARGAPGAGLSGWLAAHWELLAFWACAAWALLLAVRAWLLGRRRAQCAQLLLALERDGDAARAAPAYEAASCSVCLEDWGSAAPRVALRCGHAFCQKCLEAWLKARGPTAACPICRAPLDPGDARQAAATATVAASPSARPTMLDEGHPFWAEYSFRVRNVQRRFPDLIGCELADDLLSGRYSAHGSLHRHPCFPRDCEPPGCSPGGAHVPDDNPWGGFGGGHGDSGGGAGGSW